MLGAPTTNSLLNFTEEELRRMSKTLLLVVTYVNTTNMILPPLPGYNSRRLFLIRFGTMFPWTSSKDYRNQRGVILFWLLWTDCPNMLTSYHYPTCFQHHKWLRFSCLRSSDYMVFHATLFLTEIKYSLVVFGPSSLDYWDQTFGAVQHIIHSLMVKLKS